MSTPEHFCTTCHAVFIGGGGKCCGPVVPFDMATHGRTLVPSANAWNRVWKELQNHPAIREVAEDHAQSGNCSAASILIDAFERLAERAESH